MLHMIAFKRTKVMCLTLFFVFLSISTRHRALSAIPKRIYERSGTRR